MGRRCRALAWWRRAQTRLQSKKQRGQRTHGAIGDVGQDAAGAVAGQGQQPGAGAGTGGGRNGSHYGKNGYGSPDSGVFPWARGAAIGRY